MDGGNERVPPICPMLFPLRLSLHSDLRAIVLLGFMEGAGTPWTQQNIHTLTNVCNHGLKKKRCNFSILSNSVSDSSSLLICLSLNPVFVSCIHTVSSHFAPSKKSTIFTNFYWNINTQSHTLQHVLYVVVSVNSAFRAGLWQQWSALFDNAPLHSAAALFIVQPVSWLKVDSNLCSSFGLLVSTDFFLCPCRLWPCPCLLLVNIQNFFCISFVLFHKQ